MKPDLNNLREKLDIELRQITIDVNQAGNYFARSQYEGFYANLKTALNNIKQLMDEGYYLVENLNEKKEVKDNSTI